MENLKIAVFTDSFHPGKGGTENAVRFMCQGLENAGCKTKVYCPDYHVDNQDCELDTFRVPSLKIDVGNMMAMPRLSSNLERDLKEFEPDVIHFCSGSGMAKAAVSLGQKLNIPVVGTIHTKFDISFADRIKSRLIIKILLKKIANRLEKCQLVSVVSQSQIQNIVGYGYKKNTESIRVIKNGQNLTTPPQQYKSDNNVAVVKEKYKIQDENVFLFVGHIDKCKNIAFTLKALHLLREKDKEFNFQFVVVGSGVYLNKLKKLVKKYNLENNVVFTGNIYDRQELDAVYKTSKLFILPSIFDNDPLVVCEAASNGVPSLTMKGTGSSERITPQVNGYVFDGAEDALADKIVEILKDTENYKKVCSNLKTLVPHDWNQVAYDYIQFYNDAINNFKENTKNPT